MTPGMGDYSSLGEIASQGIEQRLAQAQRAAEARANMGEHAKLLDEAQGKMMGRLSNIATPFANIFGLGGTGNIGPIEDSGTGTGEGTGEGTGTGERSASQASTGGVSIGDLFKGAGSGVQQTNATNLLSGEAGNNPFGSLLAGIPGMVSGTAGGPPGVGAYGGQVGNDPNSLLAMQGAYNLQNTLQPQAQQQLAQMGLTAAGNLSNQFNTQLSNQFAMQRPFATAAGQAAAAIPQAIGQGIANMGNIGAA